MPPDPSATPTTQQIGDPNKTRIDVQKFYVGVELNTQRAGFRAGVKDAKLIINLGEGDGFLKDVAGDNLTISFDVGITANADGGFRLEGGTKARVTVPVGRSILGVVTVSQIELGLPGGPSTGRRSVARGLRRLQSSHRPRERERRPTRVPSRFEVRKRRQPRHARSVAGVQTAQWRWSPHRRGHREGRRLFVSRSSGGRVRGRARADDREHRHQGDRHAVDEDAGWLEGWSLLLFLFFQLPDSADVRFHAERPRRNDRHSARRQHRWARGRSQDRRDGRFTIS